MVPPTSMCTGAVYRDAAATLGIPASFGVYDVDDDGGGGLWHGVGVWGLGDEVLSVGDVAGDRPGDINLSDRHFSNDW